MRADRIARVRELALQGVLVHPRSDPRDDIVRGGLTEVFRDEVNYGAVVFVFGKFAALDENVGSELPAATLPSNPDEPCGGDKQCERRCGHQRVYRIHADTEEGPNLGTGLGSFPFVGIGLHLLINGTGRWGDGHRLTGGAFALGGVLLGLIASVSRVVV